MNQRRAMAKYMKQQIVTLCVSGQTMPKSHGPALSGSPKTHTSLAGSCPWRRTESEWRETGSLCRQPFRASSIPRRHRPANAHMTRTRDEMDRDDCAFHCDLVDEVSQWEAHPAQRKKPDSTAANQKEDAA